MPCALGWYAVCAGLVCRVRRAGVPWGCGGGVVGRHTGWCGGWVWVRGPSRLRGSPDLLCSRVFPG